MVILDGKGFTITAGLAQALHHFRHTKERIILWIDAICINQRDDEEKSYQVQMMFDIYRNAAGVRAWIGSGPGEESDDHLRPLQDKLNLRPEFREYSTQEVQSPLTTGSYAQEDQWNVWNLIERFSKLAVAVLVPFIGESLRSPTTAKAWKDLCLLLLRPYWRRVWIQQEIMEVRKVVVHCGSTTIPLTSLYNSWTNFHSYMKAAKLNGSEYSLSRLLHSRMLSPDL